MLSDNVTVCLFCYNEEARVEYAIKNFTDKFKLLVIDNFSTDHTLDICNKFGVEFVQIANHGFVEQPLVMNAVWEHVKTDYMLKTFCAEYFPDELLSHYAKVADEKSYDIVLSARVSITAGRHITVWGDVRKWLYGLVSFRFTRRGSVDYENNIIHGEGKILCKKDRILKASKDIYLMFYQFRDFDASWSEVKIAQYNDINALQLYKHGDHYSFFKMIFKSLGLFIHDYFINGAFRQGHLGFMHSYYRIHIYMGLYLRLWDIEHNLQKSQISKLHNSIRGKLLSKEMDLKSLFK
jgi:glycosyltransferase involved in cell wall biosynthesis